MHNSTQNSGNSVILMDEDPLKFGQLKTKGVVAWALGCPRQVVLAAPFSWAEIQATEF